MTRSNSSKLFRLLHWRQRK